MLRSKISNIVLANDLRVSAVLFLGAFIIRFLYLFQICNLDIFNTPILDSGYYNFFANQLLQNKPVLLYGHPFYPFFLAIIYKFFGINTLLVREFQFIFGSVSCALIYLIAKELTDKKTGLVAGIIAILYLPFIYYEGELLSESIAVFLLVAATYSCILSYKDKFSTLFSFITGMIMGGFLLIRTNLVVLAPLIGMFLVFKNYKFKKKAIWIAVFILGLILPPTLNTVFNYKSTGKLLLLPPHGGESFYIGNNPESIGTNRQPKFIRANPFLEHECFRQKASQILGKEVSLIESSNFWFIQALKFIWGHPLKFVFLLFKKILLFINGYEICDNTNYYFFKRFSGILRFPLFSFVLVSPLGMLGLILSVKNKSKVSLLYLILAFYVGSIILFFVNSRYRIPIVPYFIIFSAIAISAFISWFKNKNWKYLIKYFLILVILFVITNMKLEGLDIENSLMKAHYNYAFILQNNNKLDEAKEEYRKAIELDPLFLYSYLNLGILYAREKEYAHALAMWNKVLEIDPANKQAADNIKILYSKKKK